jgi:hypothetical protein
LRIATIRSRLRRPSLAILMLGAVAAGAGPATDADDFGRFDMGSAGWSVVAIDKRVPKTEYRLVRERGIAAIAARAVRSQALFAREVDFALDATPVLCWRWRVAGVIEAADIRSRKGDDQAARIFVGIDLPRDAMSAGTRMKLAIGRARFGKLLPDGALNYVWDNKAPVGTVVPNAYTDRARMFVLQSGNLRAGQWVSERRDVAADLKRAFGTDMGRIALIAVATDTDNTGATAEAAFADLHLVRRGQPCRF